MKNKEEIDGLKLAKEIIDKKITVLKGGVVTTDGPFVPFPDENGSCPLGWYNSGGKCVPDLG